MSDEIEKVEVEAKPARSIENLIGENTRLRDKQDKYKGQVADLETQITALIAERDGLSGQVGRVAELEGRLRDRDHRDAFGRLAADKIRSDAIDAAYTLSGWKAEADSVDEAAMATIIDELISKQSYLRVEPAVPVSEGNPDSPTTERSFSLTRVLPTPAKGSGRGLVPSEKSNNQTAYRL